VLEPSLKRGLFKEEEGNIEGGLPYWVKRFIALWEMPFLAWPGVLAVLWTLAGMSTQLGRSRGDAVL